jgi:hypothetical protein
MDKRNPDLSFCHDILGALAPRTADKVALVHGRDVVSVFDCAIAAAEEGYRRYPPGSFSIRALAAPG